MLQASQVARQAYPEVYRRQKMTFERLMEVLHDSVATRKERVRILAALKWWDLCLENPITKEQMVRLYGIEPTEPEA